MESPPSPARSPPQLRRKPKMDRLSDVGVNSSDSEVFGSSSGTSTGPFDRPADPPPATTTDRELGTPSPRPDMAAPADVAGANLNTSASPNSAVSTAFATASLSKSQRNTPYLPTPSEALLLGIFPLVLAFGALFSVISPSLRSATAKLGGAAPVTGVQGEEGIGAVSAAHFPQAATAPSYFARKDNIINQFFVKQGWFWITLAFGLFVGTHPFYSRQISAKHNVLGRRLSAILRWVLVTGWWIIVTQWCFGPPLIDRSFRLTGGGCADLPASIATGEHHHTFVTAASCKRTGGKWRGGHDISGHVFLLVLGCSFLLQEIGWVILKERAAGGPAAVAATQPSRIRAVVMADGAVKSAEVEAESGADASSSPPSSSGAAGSNTSPLPTITFRFASGVILLSLWMLLMTAIYFHTWKEKITGLAVALTGLYTVYIVPRFVPAIRRYVGLPGL